LVYRLLQTLSKMITNKSLPKHIKAVDTSKMSRKEWEQFRGTLTTLGGSDVGTCIGLNRWKSNIELFYEKLKLYKREFHDSIPMMMGRELEASIRKLIAYYDIDNPDAFLDNYHSGNKVNLVRQRHATFFNDNVPELHANIDGLIKIKGREDWGVAEIKYQSGQSTRVWENGINPSYIAQSMAYMEVLELDYAVLVLIEDANQWNVHVIERNDELWAQFYPTIKDFVERLSMAKSMIEDSVDESEKFQQASTFEPTAYTEQAKPYESFLSDYAKTRDNELVVEGDEETLLIAKDIVERSEELKGLEEQLRHRKNLVRKYMLDNQAQVITFGDAGNITYRSQLRFNIKL